jgi:CPA2 family monovalent cation:H+ antiporter-2
MGRELIVLGLAFLLAGLLARIGRRIGLPTIPLFVGAGILAGLNTPGPVLFASGGSGAARSLPG